ncbi:MAG TPA: hypothetical protein VH187_23190 [Scandinavium sp.]|jgi:hypothetical protein|uniref:hypothetical protein n=1 Tax=Scandinavium sp. TaxID=2830653 RepID=UPI002E3615A4|nr:hypothetical protein [Scandinavium sp.]HEX4504035.1 hypothetical protein [Scandinavium sp.]
MNFTPFSDKNNLPDYEWSRVFGKTNAEIDFQKLADALDCQRGFYGVGIIYDDGIQSYLVRPANYSAFSRFSQVTHITVTKVPVITRENISDRVTKTITSPSLAVEIGSTLLSCGACALTAAVGIFITGTVPFTAGMSAPLAILAGAGSVATLMQCVNGLWRLYDIEANDARNVNWIDSQDWYLATSTALDLISLASIAGPLKEAVMTYRVMKSVSSMKVTDWLKKYSRMERARLTEGIIKHLNPGISNKVMKTMIRAGKYPTRFPTDSLRGELAKQLVNAITSTMALSGSAISGVARNPRNINKSGEYVVGLLQSFSVVN